jgi:hypothetical protein
VFTSSDVLKNSTALSTHEISLPHIAVPHFHQRGFFLRKGNQGFLFCKTTFEKGDFSKANCAQFDLAKFTFPV